MDWTIILAYVITIIIVYLPITTIPISIGGGIIARLTGNFLIGALIASIIVWYIIDLIWINFTNDHIPILALGLSFITLSLESHYNEDTLNENAKFIVGGEQWGIVLISIYIIIISEGINWV